MIPYPSLKKNNLDWLYLFKVKPHGWTNVHEYDNQKYVALLKDEVLWNKIIIPTTYIDDYDDQDTSSRNSNDKYKIKVEGEFHDDKNDSIPNSEGSYEYGTSNNKEEEGIKMRRKVLSRSFCFFKDGYIV